MLFGQIFYSTAVPKETDPNARINNTPASLKNQQGGDQGFNIFMYVMIAIFFALMMIFLMWIWLISFRLTKYFGKSRFKGNSSDGGKFVNMYQNDIRVIQGNIRPHGRVRRMNFGNTPDGSFERRAGAPRGI